ncbi:MAG: hypothetical protein V1912_00010 [bacterium]
MPADDRRKNVATHEELVQQVLDEFLAYPSPHLKEDWRGDAHPHALGGSACVPRGATDLGCSPHAGQWAGPGAIKTQGGKRIMEAATDGGLNLYWHRYGAQQAKWLYRMAGEALELCQWHRWDLTANLRSTSQGPSFKYGRRICFLVDPLRDSGRVSLYTVAVAEAQRCAGASAGTWEYAGTRGDWTLMVCPGFRGRLYELEKLLGQAYAGFAGPPSRT